MALFTKRHYLATSDWLRTNIKSEQYRDDVAEAMAELYANDNEAFDAERFFTDCGLDEYRRNFVAENVP